MKHLNGLLPILLLAAFPCQRLHAQLEGMMLASDEHLLRPDDLGDITLGDRVHDAYAPQMGGERRRMCGGLTCNGWQEDHHPDGSLKHRGQYRDGQLLQFTDHRSNGTVERAFQTLGKDQGVLRVYHGNGQLRAETRYIAQRPAEHTEFHANGSVRFVEVMHAKLGYPLRMASYAMDGTPLSLRQPVEGETNVVEQRHFWPDGRMKAEGRMRWDDALGTLVPEPGWRHYDSGGRPLHEGYQVDATRSR